MDNLLRDQASLAAESRFGHKRAADMLRDGGTHVLIFPNNYTVICLYPAKLKSLACEVKTIWLRSHEAFLGSAGFGGPDDSEILQRIRTAAAGELEPWQLLSHGLGREKRDEEGLIVGDITDEVTQRAIWWQWKRRIPAGRRPTRFRICSQASCCRLAHL